MVLCCLAVHTRERPREYHLVLRQLTWHPIQTVSQEQLYRLIPVTRQWHNATTISSNLLTAVGNGWPRSYNTVWHPEILWPVVHNAQLQRQPRCH